MSDDSISRQNVIDTIDKYISGFDAIDANFLDGLKTAKKLIKELPSAQSEIIFEDVKKYCEKRHLVILTREFYDEMKRTLQSVQPEPCEDTISRKAAIDAAKHAWAKGLEPSQYIEDLPSVQTEQQELITWLLDEIWDDDAWELNYGAFPEILCRKLVKLGYVAEEGGTYVRIDAINGMPDCPNGYEGGTV